MEYQKKETIDLVALPGFLGLPEDWTTLFKNNLLANSLIAIDLFQEKDLDFFKWIDHFNLQQTKNKSSIQLLMGYSMGGRLALEALLANPSQWDAAIIISAQPGLKTPQLKKDRLIIDEYWAKRFEEDKWDVLMREWNSRAAFSRDTFHFQRNENDYDRKLLAKMLRNWSSANQNDLIPRINQFSKPILWMAGGLDTTQTFLSELNLKNTQSEVWIDPKSGHRLPWQNSHSFFKKIETFIERIIKNN